MGNTRRHPPVARLAALFSRYPEALLWAREQLAEQWGPPRLTLEPFAFSETSFYERQMGSQLRKQLVYFESLADPRELADWKRWSNRLEGEYTANSRHDVARPLNVDPGYLTEAKLVLGTTKDRDHRIYLRDGIFAEVTLHYSQGNWQARPWTYPDYMRPEVHRFLHDCRDDLRDHYIQLGGKPSLTDESI